MTGPTEVAGSWAGPIWMLRGAEQALAELVVAGLVDDGAAARRALLALEAERRL